MKFSFFFRSNNVILQECRGVGIAFNNQHKPHKFDNTKTKKKNVCLVLDKKNHPV